jgi:hypothetical protein
MPGLRRITRLTAACFILALGVGPALADSPSPYADAQGNIALPADFRVNMVHLGSWFVADGPASGFHDVYTERESVEYYRQHGRFPDGATLVKELRANDTAAYTTGASVSSANSTIKQWFVMIKDSRGHYPDNPLWGEGWGWALFKPDDPSKNVASNFKTDCLGCHEPARSTDLVYVNAYPTLVSADAFTTAFSRRACLDAGSADLCAILDATGYSF